MHVYQCPAPTVVRAAAPSPPSIASCRVTEPPSLLRQGQHGAVIASGRLTAMHVHVPLPSPSQYTDRLPLCAPASRRRTCAWMYPTWTPTLLSPLPPTQGYTWAPLTAGGGQARLAGAAPSCLMLSPYRAGELLLLLAAAPSRPPPAAPAGCSSRLGHGCAAPPGVGAGAAPPPLALLLLLLGPADSCTQHWEAVALPKECGAMVCPIGIIVKHHSLLLGGSPAGRVVLCERGPEGADGARVLCTLPGSILSMVAEEGAGAPSAACGPPAHGAAAAGLWPLG